MIDHPYRGWSKAYHRHHCIIDQEQTATSILDSVFTSKQKLMSLELKLNELTV
jgi:hypothetical protein